MELQQKEYSQLIESIGQLLKTGREKAVQEVNNALVQTYWEIGRYIVEFEQRGNVKADYGSQLFDRLSADLTRTYGRGFSRSNLLYMRKFYQFFPIRETLSHKLAWSHYFEILKSDSHFEVGFYTKQCEKEKWSVRELKRQMKSMLFHRLALSTDKEGVLKLASTGHEIQQPEDLIKDPFVLEFLNIPEQHQYLEGDLEERLISNLQEFLLELGKGFDHNDIGQMNLYLNYFKKEEATEGDNEPVGILLGAYKDHILVEYATSSITNKVLLAKYQLYLPDKKQLENALTRLLNK